MAAAFTIEDAWRRSRTHGNNFDSLRLGAAALVIVSHSFEIVAGAGAEEPLRALTRGDASFGRLAVMVFFVLSGFLLTRSLTSDSSLAAFAVRRALRIGPALAAAVVASVIVVGPLATILPPSDYARSPETWAYLANLGFYTGFSTLPGAFEGNPIPGVVNGPLWTLKFEVLCYATLAALAGLRLLNARAAATVFAALYVALAIIGEGPFGGGVYYFHQYADLARPFFAGVIFALLSTRIALTRLAAGAAAAGLLLAAPLGCFADLFPLFGGYLVLWLGFAPLGAARSAGRFGDLSYGLYLWGWPAQQIVQATAGPGHWAGNAALALPLALLFAALSWTLVEKPALDLKAALRSRKKNESGGKPLPHISEAAMGIQNHGLAAPPGERG